MAVPKRGSKTEQPVVKNNCKRKRKTEDETVDKAAGDAGDATDSETSSTREAAAEPTKRLRGNGAAHLKKRADKLLLENCELLAGLVLKNAKKGREGSTKFLVSLSEGNMPSGVPTKKRRRRGMSEAEKLRQEPEWTGTPDSEVDTGFGGREPEA